MKKVLFAGLLILTGCAAIAQQGIFYKAKFLRSKYVDASKAIVVDADLLPVFQQDSLFVGNLNTIMHALDSNPFLKGLFEKAPGSSGGNRQIFKFSASSVAGIDVTNIVNGIADLMIERAKEELNIAFFNRFKKFASDPKHPEFIILFPKTTDILDNLLSYNYPQMLPTLRSAFFDDLNQLTYHLQALLASEKYQQLLANFPEVKVAVRSLEIIHEMENSKLNAAEVIKKFADIEEWKSPGSVRFMNAGSFVRLSGMISESLRDTVEVDSSGKANTRAWVSPQNMLAFGKDPIWGRIYMGLLYQQIKNDNLKFYDAKTKETVDLAAIFGRQSSSVQFVQIKLAEFIDLTTKVKTVLDTIRAGGKITDEERYNYINLSLDVVDYAFGIVRIFDERFQTDVYLSVARKSNSLYKDIYSKQYTMAVNDGVDILNGVHDMLESYGDSIKGNNTKKKLDSLIAFVNKVKPYALFMGNMVDAKTPEDVKAALENVILPVGSSSIKKNTLCNISIQSYLGAFFAFGRGNTGTGVWSDRFGVTAPIGVSWTPGLLSWGNGGCVSVFGSVFDLGAIVDYRLRKDPSPGGGDSVITKDYSVKLGQIFSPGAYLVYGSAGNLPLSFGIGGQYGPGLSKIDATNGATVRNPGWRWNVFLAVDLPFFNVVNKTKGKR